jgi:hypothetical protein
MSPIPTQITLAFGIVKHHRREPVAFHKSVDDDDGGIERGDENPIPFYFRQKTASLTRSKTG